MQDIDFLPAEYRNRQSTQRRRSRRFVVAGFVPLVLLGIGVAQWRADRHIRAQLEAIQPECRAFDMQVMQLADLRDELKQADARAELLTYLEHPWPKTRLLSAILEPLPETVMFRSVRIARERPFGRRQIRSESEAEIDATQLPPATRDLKLLREECDRATVTMTLTGTTEDGIALHRYLDELTDQPLFDKVELKSLESDRTNEEVMFRFEARLTVRPGFGQPHGPTAPSEHLASADTEVLAEETLQP